jgi:SPP1 gp7 family putative phage head morphogenesis protein
VAGFFDNIRAIQKAILPQGRPVQIADAQAAQGMNNTSALGPGTPITPTTGYSQTPRRMDYPVGVNLNQNGRQAWGRTSFDTLDALIDAYSPARSAMNHKIDELKSMELLFNPVDGFEGDAEDAIEAARAVLARPDRVLPYEEWLSLFMEGMLRYDAGVLFKRRNMGGEIIALEVIDGSTVLPFIDEFGRRPFPPAPAYFQKIHGQVWNEFTTDNVDYLRFRPQLKSPYGLAPMESVLLSVNTDLRQQWNLLQMFTEGSIPAGFMELPPDISSPEQVAQWQEYWDSFVLGDQSKLHQMIVVPNGSKFTNTVPQKFDPLFPKYLERLTYSAFQVAPQDLGVTDDVNRATGETQTDIQFRVNTLPWVRFIEGILNRYLKNDIGVPVQVNLNTGRDTEDSLSEAQRWGVLIQYGMASADEGRQELTGLPIDNERPVPRGFYSTKSGFQPLVSALSVAGPIDPETAAPTHDAPLNIAPAVAGVPDAEPVTAGNDPETVPVQKDATAGVTTATGIAGLDLDEDEKVTKELSQFRTFKRGRLSKGSWRDFQFVHLTKVEGDALNREAREHFLAKAATGSWRDRGTGEPQSQFDLKLTDYYAPLMHKVITDAVTAVPVASLVAGLDKDSADQVKAKVSVTLDGLAPILDLLYRDAYPTGEHSAQLQLADKGVTPIKKADASDPFPTLGDSAYWDSWTPGNPVAGLKVAGSGLQTLLDDAGIQIQNVTDSVVQQIGNVLADGIKQGLSIDQMAKGLRELTDEGGSMLGRGRADIIANTESTRAIIAGTVDQYTANGVGMWSLVTADDPDEICASIAQGNPYPMSDTNDQPPVHPYCRCAMAPEVDSINADNVQTTDLGADGVE